MKIFLSERMLSKQFGHFGFLSSIILFFYLFILSVHQKFSECVKRMVSGQRRRVEDYTALLTSESSMEIEMGQQKHGEGARGAQFHWLVARTSQNSSFFPPSPPQKLWRGKNLLQILNSNCFIRLYCFVRLSNLKILFRQFCLKYLR